MPIPRICPERSIKDEIARISNKPVPPLLSLVVDSLSIHNLNCHIMNIIKQLSVLLVVLCIVEASAQDTIYYKLPGGTSFSGYGTASYRVQTADSIGFKIMEYNSEGELLREGHSSRQDTLLCEGLFRYYNDSILVSEGY